MYQGTYIHQLTIQQSGGQATAKKVDPLVPLPAVISEISSDLLFGEFPVLKMENEADQAVLDDYIMNNPQFGTDIQEASTMTTATGMLFWYLFIMDGQTFYKFIKPQNMLWEEDILGITKVQIFKEKSRSDNGKSAVYKVLELTFDYNESKFKSPYTDENRKYVTREYEIRVENPNGSGKDARVIKEVKLINEQITDFDFIPVIKIDNIKVLGSKIGKSDYQGKEQMFAELDNRVDQINHVLQEHSEPWTLIPPGVLNKNGNFNKSNGKMIEKMGGQGQDSVDIMSWDASLKDAFTQIETLIQLILFTSRISNPIAGFFTERTGSQVESGRALKWKSISTFSMIDRKRKYWNEAFRKYFKYLNAMDDNFNLSDDFKLEVLWKDGLPLDREAIVGQVVKEVNAGLKSKLSGIQQINEVTEDTAQKELDTITAEKQTQANIEASKFRVEV
jgi:hypothetical protein